MGEGEEEKKREQTNNENRRELANEGSTSAPMVTARCDPGATACCPAQTDQLAHFNKMFHLLRKTFSEAAGSKRGKGRRGEEGGAKGKEEEEGQRTEGRERGGGVGTRGKVTGKSGEEKEPNQEQRQVMNSMSYY